MCTGKITLFIDGIAVERHRYESKEERKGFTDKWATYKLGTVYWVITPDDVVYKEPDFRIEDILKKYAWKHEPYKKPVFDIPQWERPKAEYSNKGYEYLLNQYA